MEADIHLVNGELLVAHDAEDVDAKKTLGALYLEPLRKLAEGVKLDDGPTAPARVRRLSGARFELVLHEGRNRQVRRMVEAVGHRVRHLHRSVYAGLELGKLEPGVWRELTRAEIERLQGGTKA